MDTRLASTVALSLFADRVDQSSKPAGFGQGLSFVFSLPASNRRDEIDWF
tara:strand:+ start:148 stop:297 length:150 start_codon:yes stop_codon:yes gene_type:complete